MAQSVERPTSAQVTVSRSMSSRPASGSVLTARSLEPWVAQLVEHPTLDFGSGHDLTVREFEPNIRLCAYRTEPAWDSLSLCPSPARARSLSKIK